MTSSSTIRPGLGRCRAKTYRQLHATVDDIPRDAAVPATRRMPQAQRTVAGWTVKAVRNEPWLLVFMLPVLVITLTLAAIGMMLVWFVFIVAVLVLGRPHRGPARQLGRRRPARWAGVRPRDAGFARSGWRWI